jgi:hypothetical protein
VLFTYTHRRPTHGTHEGTSDGPRLVPTAPTLPRTVGLAEDLAGDAAYLRQLTQATADIQAGAVIFGDADQRALVLAELLDAVERRSEALATATADLHDRLAAMPAGSPATSVDSV